MILLAVTLLASFQTAAAPTQPSTTAPADQAASAEALALANLLAGRDMVLGASSERQARTVMTTLSDQDPRMQAIEAAAPGTTAAVIDATMPVVARSAEQRLPVLHARLASLYDRSLSGTEIERLRGFYGSPTGVRFLRGMQTRIEPDAMVASAASRRSRTPDSAAMIQDFGRAGEASAMALSPADQQVLVKLAEGGLLDKVQRMNPEAAQILLSWSQELSAEDQIEIARTAQQIVQKRTDPTGARR